MFENVEMINEEIRELEKKAKDTTLPPAQHAEIEDQISSKRRSLRDLETRETWTIAAYTIFLALLFSMIPIYAHNLTQDCIIRHLIYVGSAGGLGGVIYNILGFTHHSDKGDFNLRYRWWYFFRPITGVILGVFAFLFVAGGLMSLSGITTDFFEGTCLPVKAIMFYCALAFLAGLSTNAFVKKLNDLAGTIFMNTTDAKNEPQNPDTSDKDENNET